MSRKSIRSTLKIIFINHGMYFTSHVNTYFKEFRRVPFLKIFVGIYVPILLLICPQLYLNTHIISYSSSMYVPSLGCFLIQGQKCVGVSPRRRGKFQNANNNKKECRYVQISGDTWQNQFKKKTMFLQIQKSCISIATILKILLKYTVYSNQQYIW